MAEPRAPLPLGTVVKPYGKLVMIGTLPDTSGALFGSLAERYYWFKDRHGAIAMIPAYIIEDMVGGTNVQNAGSNRKRSVRRKK